MAIYCDILEEKVQDENWKATWIISHLRYIPLSQEEISSIELEFESDMTSERLDELYQMVNANLPDKIECGLPYNQGDILRKLDNIDKDERK